MNASTDAQLDLIRELRGLLDGTGISWWLFGGWAMDFHAGEVTRDHSDIEVFVRKADQDCVRSTLTSAGFRAPSSLHPDEGHPYLKNGQEVGITYLDRDGAGRTITPGRWADWPWVPGAFDDVRLAIDDLNVPVTSLEGLLDMKENFAKHPHGRPLREKDIDDIARLRELLTRARSSAAEDQPPRSA